MSEIEGTIFDTTQDAVLTARSSGFLVFSDEQDVMDEYRPYVCFGLRNTVGGVCYMLTSWHHPGQHSHDGWVWIPMSPVLGDLS